MAHRVPAVVALMVGTAMTAACNGGSGGGSGEGAARTTAGAATATTARAPVASTTTVPPISGVETFAVDSGHRDGPLTYPQVPPVGGVHNPTWTPCTFYDRVVPNEMAVHSLEHGAIWITYRPDLPAEQIDLLASLARSRKDIVVSRWDEGLPSALVATAWGRQLKLATTADPRLVDFVRLYANQGPEANAPC